MSIETEPQNVDPSRYTEGRDRYVNFAEDVLDLHLSREQKRILRAIAEHKRVVIMSGNGVGKSFGVAIGKLAFVATNLDSTVLGTSGSYSQYVDAVWRPMKTLHKEAKTRVGLPGETYDGGQPTLEIDDDWFAKVVSPRDPGDLEGRHAESILVVIEEADKAYIEDEHFDSAGSSVTDDNDRMIAICNPPRDEANAVYDRLESDRWHTIQFSTLDSHNVRVDAGELDEPKLPGLTDLETIIEDWEAWNGEPWPGLETARWLSDPDSPNFREDLDSRWYRRRAGVMPPSDARAHRPIERTDVEAAWERDHPAVSSVGLDEIATGVDVARSGADFTIAGSVRGDQLDIRYEQAGDNHTVQRDELTDEFASDPDHPIAVDALGEGSGLADMLAERFPETIRFGAGSVAVDEDTYRFCWEEGLDLLGDWLANGGSINDRKLYEELLLAARMVEFEERHYTSRGTEVVCATASKDDIKQRLGRSPDRLDAAYMAVWARDSGTTAGIPTTTARLGNGNDTDTGDDTDADRDFEDSEIGRALGRIQRDRDRRRGGGPF